MLSSDVPAPLKRKACVQYNTDMIKDADDPRRRTVDIATMASNFPVGERWTMVPCAALVERAGRSVIAVAGGQPKIV